MALIYCKDCGQQISDKATNCPHCGAPIADNKQQIIGNSNGFAVKLGYVFSFSSFFIFPLIFGLTGFILGVVNVIKKEDLHGWVQIALSIFSLVIEFSDAFYFEELYWF